MQILKFILLTAALVLQFDFAQASAKKHAPKAKQHISAPRSANYYKAAKYFHQAPAKKSKKLAKASKPHKAGKNKRSTASVSSGKHKKHLR